MRSEKIELLSDHLSDGPLPIGEVLRFGAILAKALRQFHERGDTCGHLDPSSIELTEDGVEFLPVPIRSEISPYTAPEQIQGKPNDPRSDLFALGAVLYEMLAGHRALAGDMPAGLRRRIMEEEPPPLDGVPQPLARIVMKCLEKRPEQRLQRAQVMEMQCKLFQVTNGAAQPHSSRPSNFGPTPASAEPIPIQRGTCPKCGAADVRPSKPKNSLEDLFEKFGVKFRRCRRCYHRFMRIAFFSILRP